MTNLLGTPCRFSLVIKMDRNRAAARSKPRIGIPAAPCNYLAALTTPHQVTKNGLPFRTATPGLSQSHPMRVPCSLLSSTQSRSIDGPYARHHGPPPPSQRAAFSPLCGHHSGVYRTTSIFAELSGIGLACLSPNPIIPHCLGEPGQIF